MCVCVCVCVYSGVCVCLCSTFHYVRHDAAWVLGARNKFKLRSLTVDCRAEDADGAAFAAAASAEAGQVMAPSQLKQKSVFICNGNDAALVRRLLANDQ